MSSTPSTARADDAGTRLRSGQLGVWAIVFFVVAAAAPLVGMTGALPPAIGLGTGAAAPGAYLLVGLILLLFSVGYAAMSHRVTNAGAFFAYIGRGLGVNLGVAAAFVSILAYLTIQLSLYGFFGGLMAGQAGGLPWWGWAALAWGAVTALSLYQVDVGAKLLGVLMLAELACLVVTSIAILANGGPEGLNFAASFSPSAVLAGGLTGSAGIAFAFAFASFIGFEATAIYGEESKDPKKTVPRATYISVVLITVIFAFVGFGMVTGLGASDIQNKVFEVTAIDGVPLADPSAMLFGLTTQFVGSWLTELFGWIVLTSLFAATLAFQNSAARYLFSMGRAGVLPKRLDHTNKQQAPFTATTVVTVAAVLMVIVAIIFKWDPILNVFYWFSSVSVIAIVLTEILVSISVIVYFRRTKEDTRAWNTMIAPVLAIIGLALGEFMLMSRFNLLAGVAQDPAMCPGDAGSGCGPFEMTSLGWFLVLLPFIVFVLGLILGAVRRDKENYDAVHNFVS